MANYLDPVVESIRSRLTADCLPEENLDELLRMYAVLALGKGTETSLEDVHNAWAAWIYKTQPTHESLVPFADLANEMKAKDRIFANAIRGTARDLAIGLGSRQSFEEILYPLGGPQEGTPTSESIIGLYKMMVDSSESLVGRRQAVNTFFLTANGALVAAYGVLAKGVNLDPIKTVGILSVAGAGVLLSFAWRSLIRSFGQLNSGKFRVINAMERHLPAAIYEAEWEALGRGEDPDIYQSFTKREIWVPTILIWVHGFFAIGSLLYTVRSLNEFSALGKSILNFARQLTQ